MDTNRQLARRYRETKDFKRAIQVYQQIWQEKQEQFDQWLGWEYGYCLKQEGKIDEAIKVCKETYRLYRDFQYNNKLLCWCIYEKYIKDLDSQDLEKYLQRAEFIIKHTIQENSNSPYESTVFKVIDKYMKQPKKDYEKVLQWLNKLKYEEISDRRLTRTIDGREEKMYSRKERYIFVKTKALEGLGRFEECIEEIDKVLNSGNELDKWLIIRKNYCVCMVTQDPQEFEKSIKELDKIAVKNSSWIMYKKIFECYLSRKQYNNAIIYGTKALLTREPINKKVNLIHVMGEMYEELGLIDNAKKYFAYEAFIRKNEGWKINNLLQERLYKYNISTYDKKTKSILENEWISTIQSSDKIHTGIIIKISSNRKSGFIKDQIGNSYYFKKCSIIQGIKELKVQGKVVFNLIESFDRKKNRISQEAINITIK